MTIEESKKSLKLKGYCDFELKDFNEEFYNLFENAIYLTPDLHNAFILFLKPFFFFRKLDKKNVENIAYTYAVCVLSDYCERILNMNITPEDKQKMYIFYNQNFNKIEDYYIHMYNELYINSKYTFEYLNNIFNKDTFMNRLSYLGKDNLKLIDSEDIKLKLLHHVFIKYNMKRRGQSKIFYEDFIKKKQPEIEYYINTEPHFGNYLNKALNNIDLHFDNNTLYITSQSAGTCVFKSLLVSIFYYLIDFNPELITKIYIKFSNVLYENLSEYFIKKNV